MNQAKTIQQIIKTGPFTFEVHLADGSTFRVEISTKESERPEIRIALDQNFERVFEEIFRLK